MFPRHDYNSLHFGVHKQLKDKESLRHDEIARHGQVNLNVPDYPEHLPRPDGKLEE
jgi:hypothetical protein